MKHERDEQCRVDPDTCLCVECGAYHGGFPCPDCGGRGFHNECCYFFAEEGRRIFELADCNSLLAKKQGSREIVSAKLATYYTTKIGGPVHCYFDTNKRAYCISGSGLPAHPDMRSQYPNGWCMLDFVKPARARLLTHSIELADCQRVKDARRTK